MKKILLLALIMALLSMCACDNTDRIIGLKEGDIRTTET